MSRHWKQLLLLVLATGFSPLAAQEPNCGLQPGWTQKGEMHTFVPDDLFDYMNGNAEGYLIYHFIRLKGVTCQNSLGDTIIMDIYEMENPDFAFGIFMANRDARQPMISLGMRAQVLPRKALLAKDKYYLELSANPAKNHSEALNAYLVALDKQFAGRTSPPEALAWFPKERLVPDSVRLVPQSVLGIRLLKAGYVGQYEFGKGFLVPEENPDAAVQVLAKLKGRLEGIQAVSAGEEAYCGKDTYLDGLCVFRMGRFLGGFAGIKNGQNVQKEVAQFAGMIKP